MELPRRRSNESLSSEATRESAQPHRSYAESMNTDDSDSLARGEIDGLMDELMGLVGLEEVKAQIQGIMSKVEVYKRQGIDLREERFHVILQGNPGTGKTTVARLYAKFLHAMEVLPSSNFLELSGAQMVVTGPEGVQEKIDDMLRDSYYRSRYAPSGVGGVIFVDEAYQLTAEHTQNLGLPILDLLLTTMENHRGKFAVIFAGYKEDMESFIEHNQGIRSRIPNTLRFKDFSESELRAILEEKITARYQGRMSVEGGFEGLYMSIAIRRLARTRGKRGFGNARLVENLLVRIADRQTRRLTMETRAGRHPNDFLFTKEDMIGPPPSRALTSESLGKLEEMVGLDAVKSTVRGMIDIMERNYERELQELKPVEFSLNRVFLGSPGTGKTTVAKLYGQILADIGLLSDGEVVLKNPSDFVGTAYGRSESRTRNILAATVGKVLVIDEAYMLHPKEKASNGQEDVFRAAIIDTIVAEVQGVPGEDRCILLLGYEEKMVAMFRETNPGLSRRFRIEDAFRFQDFDSPQLETILSLQLKEHELEASPAAFACAVNMLKNSKAKKSFNNAGEVVNIIEKAKINFLARDALRTERKMEPRILLEPIDFDRHYGSAVYMLSKCRKDFQGLLSRDIIDNLGSTFEAIQRVGISVNHASGTVPNVFILKGSPGSGKTTTALAISKFARAVGLVLSDEIVECTLTDMMSEHVGVSRRKTRDLIESSLGKVFHIKGIACLASRFRDTRVEAEVADELEYLLQRYSDRIIVIMSGDTKPMNRLLSHRPRLGGSSAEHITFRDLLPDECMHLLHRELRSRHISAPFLTEPATKSYTELQSLFGYLARLHSWTNARDVKTLASSMWRAAILAMDDPDEPREELHLRGDNNEPPRPVLIISQAIACIQALIEDREKIAGGQDQYLEYHEETQHGEPSPIYATPEATPTDQRSQSNPLFTQQPDVETRRKEKRRPQTSHKSSKPGEYRPKTSTNAQRNEETQAWHNAFYESLSMPMRQNPAPRDAGVTDEDWSELQRAKLIEDRTVNHRSKKETKKLKKVQEKLGDMAVCEAGYHWYQVDGGWRCAGGRHYVSRDQVDGCDDSGCDASDEKRKPYGKKSFWRRIF